MWPVFAATEAQIPAQAPSDRPDKPDNPIVLPLPEDSYCRAGVREADVRFVRFVRLHVGRVFVDKLHQKDPEEPTDKPDKTDNPFLRRREKNPLPLFPASPRWCRGPRIEISKLPDRQWHRPPSQARFRLRGSAGAARCSRTRSWTSSPPRAPCPRGWCWPPGSGASRWCAPGTRRCCWRSPRRSRRPLWAWVSSDIWFGWCHELSQRWRFDNRIFEFLTWLRVGEPEQVPLPEAARRRFPNGGSPT